MLGCKQNTPFTDTFCPVSKPAQTGRAQVVLIRSNISIPIFNTSTLVLKDIFLQVIIHFNFRGPVSGSLFRAQNPSQKRLHVHGQGFTREINQ